MHKYVTVAAMTAVALATTPALAHFTGIVHEAEHGHPVFGVDHLLVVLAVGVVVWALRR